MKQAWIAEKDAAVRVVEAEAPKPATGFVHLRMHAAALNFADLLMTEGHYQDTPDFPFVPGLEGAGEVIAADADSGFAPGDRVLYLGHGAMAQEVLAPVGALTALPASLGWVEAAGFQVAYGTSHLALSLRARLAPGEVLVVSGAAGGVGQTAVELGAALGARVIGLARGKARLATVRDAGAEIALDTGTVTTGPAKETAAQYRDMIRQAAREMGARGVDIVFDAVGDTTGLGAFGALKPGGRFLLIGFAGGRPPALPLNHALVKNLEIHGINWGGYRDLCSEALRTSLHDALALAGQGLIRPRAGAVLPLDRIGDAYDMLAARRQTGKLVITM